LLDKHQVFLESEGKQVDLEIVSVQIGYLLLQALLRPAKKLEPGKIYSMSISGLNEYNKTIFDEEHARWRVTDATDTEPPALLSSPAFLYKSYTPFGCGPAQWVVYCLCVEGPSPFAVHAVITEIKTGKEHSYYVQPYKGTLSIGHGMCAGEFDIKPDTKYSAVFTLMDAGGNRSPIPGSFTFTTSKAEDWSLKTKAKRDSCNCPPGASPNIFERDTLDAAAPVTATPLETAKAETSPYWWTLLAIPGFIILWIMRRRRK
jgi:hypothetical protein